MNCAQTTGNVAIPLSFLRRVSVDQRFRERVDHLYLRMQGGSNHDKFAVKFLMQHTDKFMRFLPPFACHQPADAFEVGLEYAMPGLAACWNHWKNTPYKKSRSHHHWTSLPSHNVVTCCARRRVLQGCCRIFDQRQHSCVVACLTALHLPGMRLACVFI